MASGLLTGALQLNPNSARLLLTVLLDNFVPPSVSSNYLVIFSKGFHLFFFTIDFKCLFPRAEIIFGLPDLDLFSIVPVVLHLQIIKSVFEIGMDTILEIFRILKFPLKRPITWFLILGEIYFFLTIDLDILLLNIFVYYISL